VAFQLLLGLTYCIDIACLDRGFDGVNLCLNILGDFGTYLIFVLV